MSRTIRVAAAQMGATQKSDSRAIVVDRMLALMTKARDRGANLIVFPELALTTFFPRWSEDVSVALEQWFEREMPSDVTAPLFAAAQRYQMGMSFGYAELTPDHHRYNTSILANKAGE